MENIVYQHRLALGTYTAHRLNGGNRGTHRVRSHAGEEQQDQRGSQKSPLRVVQPGEEGVGEEDRDRDAAGAALRLFRAYPLDNPWIHQELEDEHASATCRKSLQ